MIARRSGEYRIGTAEGGGYYYRINGIRSADDYANQPSAVAAATRPQQYVRGCGEQRIRPIREIAER